MLGNLKISFDYWFLGFCVLRELRGNEDNKMGREEKQLLLHEMVTYFEDAPLYEKESILELNGKYWELSRENDDSKLEKLIAETKNKINNLKIVDNAPEKIYLWKEGNMPSLDTYKENPEYRFNHDPEFKPYMIPLTISDTKTKGTVVVCAGGDHGPCTLHEGYQTCIDLNKLGYQCFLLLNRTNKCPYDSKEAGADASRAIQIVRSLASKYNFDENRVAFAGFSNGGLTAEACIQYYSGTQKINTHFKDFVPDEIDKYYGAPDAFVCVYGPRFKDTPFDYTNVVYPPVFFAVGKDDSAMENLAYAYPDLIAHHVDVELHTFAGVPHGQSGVTIYGNNSYPNFNLWPQLADVFMQKVFDKSIIKKRPDELNDREYTYDSFANGHELLNKKKGHLPAMGWNSWNAFGSGNTEKLTKDMADKIVELGLDKLGYSYIVLDDGCYKPVRVDNKLANEDVKFPGGFKALGDYIHDKGLKFGMYNDIGTNLCAGAAVGTCGHEMIDAQSYIDWGVDFIKVDNCYYLWDNATFSDSNNAKYVYAPNIKGIKVTGKGVDVKLAAVTDGIIRGNGAHIQDDYVTNIGTFDGTGPDATPVGAESGEVAFNVNVKEAGEYKLTVEYATDTQIGVGSWLQIAVGEEEASTMFYDDFVPSSPGATEFVESEFTISLNSGDNLIRLMNHRRQENTLSSYAALLEGLNVAKPDHDVIFSICEWGKTQPQNWGYKVGDSWRILNDITFAVGYDGNPGNGTWVSGYTNSVTSQYNKAVIMDEFAGLDKGWNDPDMLMVGMNGLTSTMYKTHMAMWCMMNSPLMLGLDLRRVQKGDDIYNLIANERLISLNQDALGIQAKRVFCSVLGADERPDKTYCRDNNRLDILAKPLSDGAVALSFINVSEENKSEAVSIDVDTIVKYIGDKMINKDTFENAKGYKVIDCYTGEAADNTTGIFSVNALEACDNVTVKVVPYV